MTTKVATAEQVQEELRALFAMTTEESPSRTKLAAALEDLARKVAGDPPNPYDVKNLKKVIEILKKMHKELSDVIEAEGGLPDALIFHSYLVKLSPRADKLKKLLSDWHIHRGFAQIYIRDLVEELEGLLESTESSEG